MEVSEVLHTKTHVLGRRGTNIASPLSLNVLNLLKSFLYLQIYTQQVLTIMSVQITYFDSLWVKGGGIPLYQGKLVP